jgi:hypothetical protein
MSNNKYIISGVISVIFLLFKFIEMRFLDKENKPLKELVRDAILVFFSAICAFFVLDQLGPVATGEAKVAPPPIFVGGPEF